MLTWEGRRKDFAKPAVPYRFFEPMSSVPEAHWESLTDRPEEQNSTCLEEQIDSISQVKHGCSQQPVQYCGGNQDRKENKEQTHQWQPHQYTSDYHQYVEATLWRTFAVSDMLRPLDSRQKSSGTDFRQQGDGIKQKKHIQYHKCIIYSNM